MPKPALPSSAPLPVLTGSPPRRVSRKDAKTYLWLAFAGALLPIAFAATATNFYLARVISVPVLYGVQFILTVASLYAEVVLFRLAWRARSFSAASYALAVSALAAFVYLVLAVGAVVSFLMTVTGQ